MPSVSVIIPTYNRADLIRETLDCIFAQTYQDFEVIVVDDGSTDQTEEILRETYGNRVKYIKQENSGSAIARNRGIFASQGELIAFNDSDDLWYPDKLEKQVAIMNSRPEIGFVFSDCIRGPVLETPRPRQGYFATVDFENGNLFSVLCSCNPIPASSILIRKSVLAASGIYGITLNRAQDYDLYLRIAHVTHSYRMPEVLTLLREHRGRISNDVDGLNHACRATELQVVRWEFMGEPTVSQLRKRTCDAFSNWSYAERVRANYKEAYFALRKAIKYSEQPWKLWPRALLLRWFPWIFRFGDKLRGRNHHT